MFRDELEILVKAGNGGKGCRSFRREKFSPLGGPDGGRGGDGGDVVLVADENLNTLHRLASRTSVKAQDGGPGAFNNQRGRNGKDLTIRIPIGTIVRTGDKVLADLDRHEQAFVVAKGGKGGRGNKSFATPIVQAPTRTEPGGRGEEFRVCLELKMIADVGLVGLPNAGKSTLLSRISHARPKVAAYPFTTLVPSLGVVNVAETVHFVVADLPGLIEGAHQGVGLGDRFLRHIERTRILLHLVDVSKEALQPPEEAYTILRRELEEYSPVLARKVQVVVANKMDAPGARAGLQALERVAKDVVTISASKGKGLDSLVKRLAGALGLTSSSASG